MLMAMIISLDDNTKNQLYINAVVFIIQNFKNLSIKNSWMRITTNIHL